MAGFIPDVRAAKPKRWAFRLVNIVPHVQIWAHEIHIGFWMQPRNVKSWNPIMRRPYLRINRFGVSLARGRS